VEQMVLGTEAVKAAANMQQLISSNMLDARMSGLPETDMPTFTGGVQPAEAAMANESAAVNKLLGIRTARKQNRSYVYEVQAVGEDNQLQHVFPLGQWCRAPEAKGATGPWLRSFIKLVDARGKTGDLLDLDTFKRHWFGARTPENSQGLRKTFTRGSFFLRSIEKEQFQCDTQQLPYRKAQPNPNWTPPVERLEAAAADIVGQCSCAASDPATSELLPSCCFLAPASAGSGGGARSVLPSPLRRTALISLHQFLQKLQEQTYQFRETELYVADQTHEWLCEGSVVRQLIKEHGSADAKEGMLVGLELPHWEGDGTDCPVALKAALNTMKTFARRAKCKELIILVQHQEVADADPAFIPSEADMLCRMDPPLSRDFVATEHGTFGHGIPPDKEGMLYHGDKQYYVIRFPLENQETAPVRNLKRKATDSGDEHAFIKDEFAVGCCVAPLSNGSSEQLFDNGKLSELSRPESPPPSGEEPPSLSLSLSLTAMIDLFDSSRSQDSSEDCPS